MHAPRSPKALSLAALAMVSALTLTACGPSEEEKAVEDAQKQAQELQDSLSGSGEEGDESADGGGASAEETAEDVAAEESTGSEEGSDESSSDESEGEESSESELVDELSAGAAAELSGVPDELDLEDVEKSKDNLVEVFGAHYTVEQVAKTETLPKDLAEEVGGDYQDYADEVKAAEGEAFYVAVVRADDPRHDYEGEADAPTTTTGYRVDGNPMAEMSLPDIQVGDKKAIVVSADADAEPEDVTLEIEQDSVSQELSLVDGSRANSDVEKIYERGTEVEVGDPSTWEVTAEHERHSATTVSGEVDGGVVLPAHPEHGWPAKGKVFLGLDISATEPGSPFYDSTQAVLEFEDGTTARWVEDPHQYPQGFGDRVWFEVPADAEEAELQLDVQVQISTEKNKSLKDVTVPLTITGELGEEASEDAEKSDEKAKDDEAEEKDEKGSDESGEAEPSESESGDASESEESASDEAEASESEEPSEGSESSESEGSEESESSESAEEDGEAEESASEEAEASESDDS